MVVDGGDVVVDGGGAVVGDGDVVVEVVEWRRRWRKRRKVVEEGDIVEVCGSVCTMYAMEIGKYSVGSEVNKKKCSQR